MCPQRIFLALRYFFPKSMMAGLDTNSSHLQIYKCEVKLYLYLLICRYSYIGLLYMYETIIYMNYI